MSQSDVFATTCNFLVPKETLIEEFPLERGTTLPEGVTRNIFESAASYWLTEVRSSSIPDLVVPVITI